jgi:hypothetical protein
MCTVVLSLDPGARVPLKLLGVRDELVSRPWRPPARHWPGSPLTSPLIGGIDEEAGGTWLAVHPGLPRMSCVLNGHHGALADPARRRSRGELPLRAAAEGPGVLAELAAAPGALAAYDPFILISASPAAVTFLTWWGDNPQVRDLAPGTHLFTNEGHAYPADPAHPEDPRAEPKAEHFAAKFAAARPSADPALSIAGAWGDWLTLTAGDQLDPADPGALIARRDLPGRGMWGSTSVTLVGLGTDALRYDFQPHPGSNLDGWYSVAVALSLHLGRYGAGMPKARTTAIAVGCAVVAATLLAAAPAFPPGQPAPASVVSGPGATGPGARVAPARITVQPDAIELPGARRSAPLTTAQCKALDGIACFLPSQLRAAYHLNTVYGKGITGKGQTIAIVDSFGSPTIRADLAAFDKQLGIAAPPKFTVIAPVGKIPKFNPLNSDMAGWAGETTLDVEYAHALAPGASILLVETPVAETEGVTGFPQIVKAEEYAIAHYKIGVISQSFSATEETFTSSKQITPLRAAYTEAEAHKVTVLAASGDAGATDYTANQIDYYTKRVTSWPDSDPLVTAVGGTRLEQTKTGYTSVAWNDTYDNAWNLYSSDSTAPVPAASGGGVSEFFGRPSYQDGVKAVTGARRGVPDVSMSASCDGSVSIYSSYQGGAGWSLICGTSEATPEFAAVVALADQVAGHPLGLINPLLYSLSAKHAPGLVDVTSGNNTVSFYQGSSTTPYKITGYAARKGYDLVTGVGTVNAEALVYELAAK